MKHPDKSAEARDLLRHGGLAVGLAAVALAAARETSEPIRFRVLAPHLTRGAGDVIEQIHRGVSPGGLETVIQQALERGDATRPPRFANHLIQNPSRWAQLPDQIAQTGNPTLERGLAEIFEDYPHQEPAQQGLMILACALCRAPDSVAALAALLPPPKGEHFFRAACLAGVKAREGLPSALRHVLRGTTTGKT